MDAPSFSSINSSRAWINFDAEHSLSMEKVFFNNLLLLGFDVQQNEKKYKIAFHHEMFRNPNVKGMEVVLHYLLNQMYPERMSEV
jgi:hypothetical protein